MTQAKLSTITLQTIENYRHAAERAVKAYRVGGHRLAHLVNDQLKSNLYPRADKLVPAVSEQVLRLQNRAFELTTSGIDLISENTDRLVTIGANGAATGVHKFSNRVAGIESAYLSKGVDAAARLNLPSARLALAISVKLSEGAEQLLSAAAGPIKTPAKAGSHRVAAKSRRNVKSSGGSAAKRATTAKTKAVRKARTVTAQAEVAAA